jgi:transketolase
MTFEDICKSIRRDVAKMMHKSYSSHIGGCYSVTEILVTLYFEILNIDPKNPRKDDRDILLLSKAHSSPALYAILSQKGFFPKENLDTYYQDGGKLPGHLDKEAVPGIEFSFGSLGHGLSVGVGMALANKRMNNPGRVFVILSDGECNEGSVWEAAMFAPHHKLSNLTAVIDYNKIQSFGATNEVINQEPIFDKWKSFGWKVLEIDGHDHDALFDAFNSPHEDLPKLIIANTVKGKGVSFMENSLDWHYKSPNDEQLKRALKELE